MNVRAVDHVDLILGGPRAKRIPWLEELVKIWKVTREIPYKLYFQAIERYSPEMFVFENVPGLLTAGGTLSDRNIVWVQRARLRTGISYSERC